MGAHEEVLAELDARVRRYPADRYPVQHATARFHLGVALANAGRTEEALDSLAAAARLFDPERLPGEHGKALNALGAALRLAGRLEEARTAFEEAAGALARTGGALDEGAARFNVGLVLRDLGRPEDALAALARARELLVPRRAPAQAGAAARELGSTLLTLGRPDEATPPLEEAVELARHAGDHAGLGEAANLLGLARLALGADDAAEAAFTDSVAAHPRSVRPESHAMAKANLALAHERRTDAPRARLAARQALGVPDAPAPVREQAERVLARLGDEPDDLFRVLEAEPRERWSALVREDVLRWVDAEASTREAEADRWITGQLVRRDIAVDLAHAWLSVLLELSPDDLETVVGVTVCVLSARAPEERARFRTETEQAMARFHAPQLLRLRDTFARLDEAFAGESGWAR